MKIKLSLIICSFNILLSVAQVGIGINTYNPTNTLHVNSTQEYIFKLPDLSSTVVGEEKVIVSDDNLGTVSAKTTNIFKNIIFGNLPTTASALSMESSAFIYTTITIGLPKGRWAVIANILLELESDSSLTNTNGISYIVEGTLGPNTTVTSEINYSPFIEDNDPNTDNAQLEDFGYGLFKGVIKAPLPRGIFKGAIIVNNNTYRQYRLHIRFKREAAANAPTTTPRLKSFGNTSIKENQIYAIPLN